MYKSEKKRFTVCRVDRTLTWNHQVVSDCVTVAEVKHFDQDDGHDECRGEGDSGSSAENGTVGTLV